MNAGHPDTGEQGRYEAVIAADPAEPPAREALFAALYDPSWRVRKAAADRLRQVSDPRSVVLRLLAVLAERGQTGARNAAAEALVLIGEPAVEALIRLLEHDAPDQRRFAADILGAIGSRNAEGPLVRAVADPDPNVRVSAAEALGQVGGDAAAAALEQALGCGDPLLQLSALGSLTRLEVAPPLPVLTRLAGAPPLRRAATRALGFVQDEAALHELGRALCVESPTVREAALGGIGLQARRGSQTVQSSLEAVLGSVARREPRFPEWVDEGLGSEDVEAVRGALFCHRLLAGVDRVRRIAEAAEDGRVAEDAFQALVRRGMGAAPALAEALETLGACARLVAAEALVELAEPSLVPLLVTLSHSSEPEIRLFAVRALGRSRSALALPAVAALLADAELGQLALRVFVELALEYPETARAELERRLAELPSAIGAGLPGEQDARVRQALEAARAQLSRR